MLNVMLIEFIFTIFDKILTNPSLTNNNTIQSMIHSNEFNIE